MNTNILSKHETLWLRCDLDKGMFSDEVAVTYPPNSPPDGNWEKSVFVPASDVKGDIGSIGKVRVRVLGRDEGKVLAVLPNPHQDIVVVDENDTSVD